MKEEIQGHFKNNYRNFYEKYLQAVKHIGGNEFQGLCPFHEDKKPSFCFNNQTGQYFCHGCGKKGDIFHFYGKLHTLDTRRDFPKILRGIADDFGIPWEEKKSRISKIYDYLNADGKLHSQTIRMEPKSFWQRRPNGNGGWITKDVWKDVKPILYHLPDVGRAQEIVVVEGERDADTLSAMGFTGTTCPMGAGKWLIEYNESLRGKDVVLIPDNDNEGREHMIQAAMSLNGNAKSLKWIDLPNLHKKKGADVSDWVKNYDALDDASERLAIMITEAELYEPPEDIPKQSVKTDVSARVREYLLDEFDGGIFRLSDLKRELNLNDSGYTLARQCVKRMAGQGQVQKHGHQLGSYRVVDRKKSEIKWEGIEAKPSKIILLGGLHNVVVVRDGDMICFTGYKNSDKTAIAIEILRPNLDNFQVHFFMSEYKARMKRRLQDFGIDLNHQNLHAYQIDKSDYIPDKIEPGVGVLNVIDHFPNLDNFYLVGKYQDEIHRALDGAICIITHQKKKPEDLDAIGGSFWTITPTLAVTLFQDDNERRMQIRKGKEPGEGIFNANGMSLKYKLTRGCQFTYDKAGWK